MKWEKKRCSKLSRQSTCILLIFMLSHLPATAQVAAIKKDLDGDGKKDIVFVDTSASAIVCKLSTQHYKTVQSQPLDIIANNMLKATTSGFEVNINFMRAGYSCQFRYNKKTRQMQLIGISHYEFGPASNDGSGKSSVNLLTGDYIGKWNYYDMHKEKLFPLPVIKTKMHLSYIGLENFSADTYYHYSSLCSALYNTYKNKIYKQDD